MKIYTKTGDKGTTGLIGGTRVSKADPRLEAYGTVDELNTHIGLLVAYGLKDKQTQVLHTIQNLLFTIGSNLATDTTKTNYKAQSVIKYEFIAFIEKQIDDFDEVLPPLTQFILPGGSTKAAQAHICRTVTRRAERRMTEIAEIYNIDNMAIIFINRLSDYFFSLARYLLWEDNKKEIAWSVPKL